jgi:hypothetical protein
MLEKLALFLIVLYLLDQIVIIDFYLIQLSWLCRITQVIVMF